MTAGRVASWLAMLWRFLRRFETRVLVGLVLAAGALWAFLEIGGEMAEGETQVLDERIILALRTPGRVDDPIGPTRLEEVVRDVTALGGTTLVTLFTIVAVFAFLFHRRYRHAAVLGATVLLAAVSSSVAKALYGRPRPDLVPHGVEVYSNSFPSGHSTLAAATYLTLAAMIASLEARRRSKALVYGVAVALVVTVGASRVYLGVHWPSDVLAGWFLGAGWALLAWIVLRRLGGQVRG